MYDELIKRLRRCEQFQCRECEYEQVTGCRAKLNEEATDAIEELQAQINGWIELERKALIKSVPKWINVKERLPEDKETCLIWYEYYHYSLERVLPEYGIGFYLSMYDMWYGGPSTGKDVKVLYWMPLPEPPEEV